MGNRQLATIHFERLVEDLRGQREWIHAGAVRAGIARVLEPFDHHLRPADAEVCGGHHFQGCARAVEGKTQAAAGDLGEQAAAHGIAALQTDVHLDIVNGLGANQVKKTLLARFVLAGREWDQILLFQAQVAGVIFGRKRFFEPRDVVSGHFAGQLFDGVQAVVTFTHAPPRVGVHHQIEVGTQGHAQLAHGV